MVILTALVDQIAGLADLSLPRLRAEWRRLHRGQPLPEGMSRDLLVRGIAWALQAKALGDLPPARMRDLSRLARQLDQTGELERPQHRKAGTRLVRQWHDQVYVVTVLDQGYEFEGRHYPALTPIARAITGAAWSGPRFFGLKSNRGKSNWGKSDGRQE